MTENLIVLNKCSKTIRDKKIKQKGESYLGMFNSNGQGYSLSDIAAVTEGNNNGGWGNNGDWWILLLFLFAFGGFGGYGFGGGRNGGGVGGSGAATRGDLDYMNLDSGIRGIQQGLCDGFYAMNTGMLNGFTGVQNAITTGFHGVDTALCNLGYQTQAGINSINVANMQNTNALSRQLADCCCENRAAIADVKYQMAANNCALQNTMANNTRDIIDSQRESTRSILDFLVSDKLSTLQTENQNLKLKASQAEQNNYLVNALRPSPIPAYTVPSPYQYQTYGCGCTNPCGNLY